MLKYEWHTLCGEVRAPGPLPGGSSSYGTGCCRPFPSAIRGRAWTQTLPTCPWCELHHPRPPFVVNFRGCFWCGGVWAPAPLLPSCLWAQDSQGFSGALLSIPSWGSRDAISLARLVLQSPACGGDFGRCVVRVVSDVLVFVLLFFVHCFFWFE